MFSGRVLVLGAALAAGYWLWSTGKWQEVVAQVPVLAKQIGQAAPGRDHGDSDSASAGEPATTDNGNPAPDNQIRTWVDAQGVRHFANATTAPKNAVAVTAGGLGTMAEYEQAMEQETGIRPQDIARARATQAAVEAAETTATATGLAGETAAGLQPVTSNAPAATAALPQQGVTRKPVANLAIQQIEEAKQQSGGVQVEMQRAVDRTRTLVKPE